MGDENLKRTESILNLEYDNKKRAVEQAREINRGLTRLKKISSRPGDAEKNVSAEPETTEKFITVTLGELQAKNIEDALTEAGKSCSESPITPAKVVKKLKNKWVKWRS